MWTQCSCLLTSVCCSVVNHDGLMWNISGVTLLLANRVSFSAWHWQTLQLTHGLKLSAFVNVTSWKQRNAGSQKLACRDAASSLLQRLFHVFDTMIFYFPSVH